LDIEKEEKVTEETCEEIKCVEEKVIGLNNLLAGRRGKTTFSDKEHPFTLQAEKLKGKTQIESLSVELEAKRPMRNQSKTKYLELLRKLSAARKEYLKLVLTEKDEVQAVIDKTPFCKH